MHDQNDRFMPIFVLSLHGKDWRQPITQYSDALAFKIFGGSFQNLREVSVFYLLFSAVLIFYLGYQIGGTKLAIIIFGLFITTPLLMIQAHLGLDNIAPVPFTILWLIGIYQYQKNKQLRWLVLAGLGLGLGFYTYKAMRLIVPVWGILSLYYLFYLAKFNFKDRTFLKSALVFIISGLPFVLAIPLLQWKYPGSIFDNQRPSFDSYQAFFGGYLSNLDWTFLFITGDSTLYHSTSRHGEFLLASLPLFLIGAYQAIKKRDFSLFALLAFFSAPIFFGTVNSEYRASRLLALIPPFTLVSAFGFWTMLQLKNKFKPLLIGLMLVLLAANYDDFVNFYWFSYPEFARVVFTNNSSSSYFEFAKVVNDKHLAPFVEKNIYTSDDTVAQFYESAYFNQKFTLWSDNEPLPANSALLTNSRDLPGMTPVNIKLPHYTIQIHQ
jgi:4-amino-4-deoxy-L-arabinose transferase-like glycosyltransferase